MTSSKLPLVSIVVLNWNGLEDTKLCLEHLKNLDYGNYEIIVVDNGSSDGSKDFLSKIDDIKYIDNIKNRGFTGGHIDGLKHADGEFIMLLNNDAVVQSDYLTKAMRSFSDLNVAAVGGRAYYWNDTSPLLDLNNPFYSYMNVNVYTGEAQMQSSDYTTQQEVNVVSGAAVVVRRSVINEVGYLYDRFFAYFEETDLFARMKRAGYKIVYNPDLHIWHRNGASSGSNNGSYFFFYQIFRNRFIFAVRNFEPWFMRHFMLVYAKISLVSLLQIFRDPSNRTMHRAYAAAAFYNLLTLPQTLLSRSKLHKKLGPSNYNHQIHKEQTGISRIIDGTELHYNELAAIRKSLAKDDNPLHEYVIVTRNSRPLKSIGNVRFVVDRNFFETSPLNLGCLASRYPWMLVGGTDNLDMEKFHETAASMLRTKHSVVAHSAAPGSIEPYLLLRKDAFELKGGVGNERSLGTVITNLIDYAQIAGLLTWSPTSNSSSTNQKILYNFPEKNTVKKLERIIKRDIRIRDSARSTWLDRLQLRFYRFYQLVTFLKWLIMNDISLHLKLARIKNLILFATSLRVRLLATEFRHIRNEVLIHSNHHPILEEQKMIVKKRLAERQKNPASMPVFIICRDRLEPLLELVEWLKARGMKKIVFIDNDSSYPPLVEYYERTPYQVLRLFRNIGHTSPWTLATCRTLVPDDFYIVTDPDVIPSQECPDNVISHFLNLHKQYFAYEKVGFGLRIDDLPDHYLLKQQVVEWESQFWNVPLEDNVYEAGVDTTFAVYKPYTYVYSLHPSIRTGFPYVARHLPWYVNPANITSEELYYRARVNLNVTSWNTDVLAERYAREMKATKQFPK